MDRREKRGDELCRRDFVRQALAGAAGLGLAAAGLDSLACSADQADTAGATAKPPEKRAEPRKPSVVVRRFDAGAFGKTGHDTARVRRLVDSAVAALVGVANPSEAYRALFSPKDVVSIKVNCLAGPGLSSSVSVVAALVSGLRSIGVADRDIHIWERSSAELERAGFTLNRHSETMPRCFGNDEGGFEKRIETSGDVGSLWSNAVAGRSTALVNVPVLKDHDLAGVGSGMKNMYGAIHNPNRYHDNNCDPYVAHVNAHPYIKDKLRLVLADALTAQFHGGPARSPSHQWRPAAVLAATDPVALDRIAQEMIDSERFARSLPSLAEARRPPSWLKTAASLGLGEADRASIALDEA